MSDSYCTLLQERLADPSEGLDADADAQAHLASCAACREQYSALRLLDEALADLPRHEPSDATIDALIASVRSAQKTLKLPEATSFLGPVVKAPKEWASANVRRVFRLPRLPLAYLRTLYRHPAFRLTVTAAVLVVTLVSVSTYQEGRRETYVDFEGSYSKAASSPMPRQQNLPVQVDEDAAQPPSFAEPEAAPADSGMAPDDSYHDLIVAPQSGVATLSPDARRNGHTEYLLPQDGSRKPQGVYTGSAGARLAQTGASRSPRLRTEVDGLAKRGTAQVPVPAELDSADGLLLSLRQDLHRQKAERRATVFNAEPPMSGKTEASSNIAGRVAAAVPRIPAPIPDPENPEEHTADFFRSMAATTDLQFQEATGYWSNTYLPGDPTFRRLQSALLNTDLDRIVGPGLHHLAEQPQQPFDAPSDAALAVYLHAEQSAIRTPTRLRVQVGLKGAERKTGSRQGMNLCLVLDLRAKTTPEQQAGFRALAFALNAVKQVGDRFCLIAAGRPTPQVVAADDFRHGSLSVALETLFNDSAGHHTSAAAALEAAIAAVGDNDDPTAPLGTSAILFAGAAPLADAELEGLSTLAHQSAVIGIPISTITVGSAPLPSHERLALAGQGSRRSLSTAAGAEPLIARELAAVSETIARAVRLRIRLAPGVKLVGLLGSQRLEERSAEQVRQAEQSIDRRLARNLGIEADRGEDEEGMQIVIPAYRSGDAHVLLLDVVVERPGPIADVTVRYKDLLQLKNGVARARLTVESGERPQGPLEQNVTKNFLSFTTAQALQRAGNLLVAGQRDEAREELRKTARILEGLAGFRPELARDSGIQQDLRMTLNYLRALDDWRDDLHTQLGTSLHFAAKRKLLPTRDELSDSH